MEKKALKLEFIENGRLTNGEMSQFLGGVDSTTYQDCTKSGPGICSNVKGNVFTITANCTHNLYTCRTEMQFCTGVNDLATCAGLPSDTKQVVRTSIVSVMESVSLGGQLSRF